MTRYARDIAAKMDRAIASIRWTRPAPPSNEPAAWIGGVPVTRGELLRLTGGATMRDILERRVAERMTTTEESVE